MRACGASELRNISHFHILKLLFPSIFCWYLWYFVSETYIFRSQITSALYYTINAVSFYYLWYGTMYVHKQRYTDKTLTLWKCMYTRASGASELRKCWYFYIIKVIFLSIWMGRNNHLQIKNLKHIWRMHKHDFCGEQCIYTRAILANWKICMHDFFFVGGTWGGTENLWGGGHVPPPRSYAPGGGRGGREIFFENLCMKTAFSCTLNGIIRGYIGYVKWHIPIPYNTPLLPLNVEAKTNMIAKPGGGGGGYSDLVPTGVCRRLKPPNPNPSLRVILAEKSTHYYYIRGFYSRKWRFCVL